MKICSVEGCENKRSARGLCGKHYYRITKLGSLLNKSEQSLAFIQATVGSNTNECIIWPYGKKPNGYGCLIYEGKSTYAHRLALALSTGGMKKGLDAAHGPCRNRLCINPRHLRWATRKENEADKIRDGVRHSGGRSTNPKMSDNEALEIHARRMAGESVREIFLDYQHLSIGIIHDMIARRTFKNLNLERIKGQRSC